MIRDDLDYEVEDDGGLLFKVERTESGAVSAMVRVYGRLTIDGQRYEYDRDVRVSLTRSKE